MGARRVPPGALPGARAEMAGTITVKKMGGAKVDVPIGPTTTVADVKAELVLELGVALAQQKLLFKGKPLADDKPLREYRIGDGSALNLMTLKPKKAKPGAGGGGGGGGIQSGFLDRAPSAPPAVAPPVVDLADELLEEEAM